MKGIIFDLDGVLVFTDCFHYEAWKAIADEYGIYFDEEINNRLRGVGRMESLDIILEKYEGEPFTQQEKEKMASRKNDIYRELLQKMTPQDVTEEVRKTLEYLKERGYLLALGSSSKNAKFILEKVDLYDAFDAISDGTNITYTKPNPEVFLKAAEFLQLEPQECAVVEDAFAGIDAAKAGGMTAIAIGDAVNARNTDFKLTRFSDLLEICKGR